MASRCKPCQTTGQFFRFAGNEDDFMLIIIKMHILFLVVILAQVESGNDRLRPFGKNTAYWEYQNRPVLLIGGSDDDNLFQWDETRLRRHLDLLAGIGGNYVRNTMSSRDDGNIWPFARDRNGKYDLNRLNDDYWRHFETLLRLAIERTIIVQIEVWDRFDFAREPWALNPYNPAINLNYTTVQSRLEAVYPRHPGQNDNPFFRSVPALENNQLLLKYQHAQVDRMLSISLKYPNVIYCMDNETNGRAEWGAYWADYIRRKSKENGLVVQLTEMWDPWDLSHELHRNTFDHPDLYTFLDVSQNNHQKGQAHWDNFQKQRQRINDRLRPMNNVKIYGADTGRFGSSRDGAERFWRSLIGGAASVRFHRPDSGIGLSTPAQAHIRSARMLTREFDFFSATPDAESRLLLDREQNEAYLTRLSNEKFAIYFPDGGEVRLDLREIRRDFRLRWLDIEHSRWTEVKRVSGGDELALSPPRPGHWVAMLEK